MKITPHSNLNNINYKNSVSFSGNRLLKVAVNHCEKQTGKIGETTRKIINKELCYFTEMTPQDYPVAERIVEDWSGTDYGPMLAGCFRFCEDPKTTYYMLESAERPEALNKARAIVKVYDADDSLEVDYLQSGSKVPGMENMYGAGQAMMYGICKLAQHLKKQFIELVSTKTSKSWYKKLGMEVTLGANSDGPCYRLTCDKFPEFFRRIENKNGFEPAELLNEPIALKAKSVEG